MKRPNIITRTLTKISAAVFSFTQRSPELYRAPYYDEKLGITVNSFTAMQLDAVWSCVRLIAETIATLPLSMYERTGKAGRRYASQHALHYLIHDQPNGESTAAVFWEAMVAAMLLRGAGRAEKLMLGTRVVGLMFLDPSQLTITQHWQTGRTIYKYPRADNPNDLREIPAANVWTVPGFTLDGMNGVSVVHYGAKVFGSAIAAESAAAKTFSNGMLQTVYYKVAEWLKPQQRTDFKENVLGTIERGETPLLESGIDVGTVGLKPEDAQLLQTRGYNVETICRWFRVPPWMVGHTEKSTSWGTGIEQQMIGFLTFTLMPWLRRIEQAISKDLLSPGDRTRFYAKFSVEGLLRADSAARAAFYAIMVSNGIFTRDEVRELEEREPMGGNAAVLTVQSAMMPLDKLGMEENQQLNEAREVLSALLGIEIKSERVTQS